MEAKRAVPPQVAEKGIELAEKALEKQLEVMAEQQKKGQDFVNKEVRVLYQRFTGAFISAVF